jgi:phospholipase C
MRQMLRRPGMILFSGLLLCTIGLLAILGGCGGGTASSNPPPPPSQKIQHVVVIFQENRTPDNLFQDPVLIKRGADIQTFGVNSQGQHIPLVAHSLGTDYDPAHTHNAFLAMYDGGKMDGADKVQVSCDPHAPPPCPPPNPTFQSVSVSDAAPYFALAEAYTFGDRMFQTNQGPSFPAHQFIISGTSAPSAGSTSYVAENPFGGHDPFSFAGCTAPPEELVNLIDPSGSEAQEIYPCSDHATLTDLLNAAKISWRYYAPSAGIIWNAPNAIEHMCVPNAPPPNGTACTGSDWTNNVVLNSTQVLTDIANGQLATVSWVIPTGQASDHAGLNQNAGPSWVASVVNAIGNSSYWSDTAIIITWDDWGGWYDHVTPAAPTGPGVISSYEYGFRVPLIVVSPYAKANYISHQVNDFGSILKFIEGTFGLPTVAPGASPAYADATSVTADLSDCFDFNQTPLTYQTIPAPLDARHFLEDKTPPTAPDND